MENWQTVLIIIVIGIISAIACVLLAPIANSSSMLETLQLQAEADSANARANELEAQAELTEEQAALEVAQGERALAEAQGEALTEAVKSANRIITLWGITFPLMPLVYGGISGCVGLGAGCAIGYAVGLNRALLIATARREPAIEQPCQVPRAKVQGA